MSVLAAVLCTLLGAAAGAFVVWLQVEDRIGTYRIGQCVHERSGWMHDGVLHVAVDRERDLCKHDDLEDNCGCPTCGNESQPGNHNIGTPYCTDPWHEEDNRG